MASEKQFVAFVTATIVVRAKIEADNEQDAREMMADMINGTQGWQAWGEPGHTIGRKNQKLLGYPIEPSITALHVD